MRLSRFYFLLLLFLIHQIAQAQQPLSFTENVAPYHAETQEFHFDPMLNTATNRKNGTAMKIGRCLPAAISPELNGHWEQVNGNRIWRLRLVAPGAAGMILYPDKMQIPENGHLWVYSEDGRKVYGPYRNSDNPEGGHYALDLVGSEKIILEYNEPNNTSGKLQLHISEVGYVYHHPFQNARDFGQSDVCEVNVNCPEGSNWQPEKNAVAMILLKIGPDLFNCSGTLLNNVRRDCTPYFLTADHCYEDDQTGTTASTADLNQWKFYFGYESPYCNNPSNGNGLDNKVVTGCKYVASSNDHGGDTGSDFFLLKMNSKPPDSFHAFYAGWDNRNIAVDSGVCMHHPNGDIKKISTFQTRIFTDAWGTSVANTHWRVEWGQTASGYGVTEPGSSGSALFSTDRAVIGTLTGGNSYCTSPTDNDFFGKMWYHWTSNGSAANRQLKPWLDPDNTGAATLNGMTSPCYPAGVSDAMGSSGFLIYPNPTSGLLQLQWQEGMESIRIFNVMGAVVLQQSFSRTSQTYVDVRVLPDGVFWVETTNNSGNKQIRSFVKRQ